MSIGNLLNCWGVKQIKIDMHELVNNHVRKHY